MVQRGLSTPTAEGVAFGRLQQYGPYAITLYLLATTRWGSGVSLVGGPPYISDLILLLLVCERALAAGTHRSVSTGIESWVGVLATALLTWSMILLAFGSISQDALRDAAPYLYVVTIFLVRPPSKSSERATSRALMAVLILHAAWVSLALLDSSLPDSTPVVSTGIHLLSLRPDIDSLVCGLLAALGLHHALAGRRPAYNLALAAWGTVLVFALYDRAGLLAFIVELVVIGLLAPARKKLSGKHDGRVVVAIMVMCLPIVAVAVSQSKPVKRLLLTVPGNLTSSASAEESQGASGTAHARLHSWSALVSYIEQDTAHDVRGVGFGPDYLQESGAAELLLGPTTSTEVVRSPHNYLLNTWARLGLVGLALILGLFLAGVRLARLVAKHAPRVRDDDVLAMLLAASVPVVAAVGVVFESPFGALPYFWAIGHLSARACQIGAVVPFGVPALSREPGYAD